MRVLYALAGLKFRPPETREYFASLKNGSPLILKRAPDNPHDRNAIEVWSGGHMIGFVSGKQNASLALAMDAMPAPHSIAKDAKLAIDGGKWPLIEVE